MIQPSDFVTIALLVALEGLLSADNAMVLAVLVLGLPKSQQKKALRYGILGAFAFRSRRDAARGLPDPARLGEARRRGATCCISSYQHFCGGERRGRGARRRRRSRGSA